MLFINRGWIVVHKEMDNDLPPPTPQQVQNDLFNDIEGPVIAISSLQYKGNETNVAFTNFPKTEHRVPLFALFVISYPQIHC